MDDIYVYEWEIFLINTVNNMTNYIYRFNIALRLGIGSECKQDRARVRGASPSSDCGSFLLLCGSLIACLRKYSRSSLIRCIF